MPRFHVKHNWNKYAFRTWVGTTAYYVFGADNEGIFVDVPTLEEAKVFMEKEYNLNPFYLSFTETTHPNNRR